MRKRKKIVSTAQEEENFEFHYNRAVFRTGGVKTAMIWASGEHGRCPRKRCARAANKNQKRRSPGQ